MAKGMSVYYNAFGVFKKKLSKKLNDDDVASLKLAGIASGVLLMSFIPDFTKKLRTLLLVISIILIIPTIIKVIKLLSDMLK
ncbi:MAG: hypothetical protein IKW59_02930 [Clostridia bacterium]|nr:hypothetical protein [Clostridia bacterium]